MILKLVLQGLSSPWQPNMQVLMKSHDMSTDKSITGGASVRSGRSNKTGQRTTITRLSDSSNTGELSMTQSNYNPIISVEMEIYN